MLDTENEMQNEDSVLEKPKVALPPEYVVVMYNDDFTTKDFVVEILMQVFHKSEEEAVTLMETIHNSGKCQVGVYPYDIAATYVEITRSRAKAEGFPLRCEYEER